MLRSYKKHFNHTRKNTESFSPLGTWAPTLNMWQKRGHIKKNMDGTYSKTEAFVLKNGHYGAPVAA